MNSSGDVRAEEAREGDPPPSHDRQAELRRYAVKSSLSLTISVGITMAMSFVLRFALPRILGTQEVGSLYLGESFSLMFFCWLPLGLGTYIVQNASNPRGDDSRNLLPTLLVFELLFASFLACLLVFGAWSLGYHGEVLGLILLMGAYNVVNIMQQNITKKMFLARGLYRMISRFDIVLKALAVSCALTVLWLGARATGVAAVQLGCELLGAVTLLGIAYKRGWMAGTFDLPLLRRVVVASLPFFVTGVFVDLYSTIDVNMLARLAQTVTVGEQQVGLFGAANRLRGVFLLMLPVLSNALYPLLAGAHHQAKEQSLAFVRDLLVLIATGAFALTALLILLAPEFCALLYGEEFGGATAPLIVLAPSLILIYVNVALTMLINLSNRGKTLAGAMCAGTLVNILFDWLSIGYGALHWGENGAVIGAAVGSMAAELFVFAVLLWIAGASVWSRRGVWALLVTLVATLGLSAASVGLPPISLVGRAIILGLGVPVFARLTGLIRRRDLSALRVLLSQFPRLRQRESK